MTLDQEFNIDFEYVIGFKLDLEERIKTDLFAIEFSTSFRGFGQRPRQG